jgi:REP element-mobilizing transposase RayT
LETYLDQGRGSCFLSRPDLARLVEDAVCFFHGQRYDLRAWVVMPNRVHAVFKVDSTPMSEIVGGWKNYTANEANKVLGFRGAFWEADYWDTYMRSTAHELQTIRYTENNPSKAGFVLDPKKWSWSSARFRDEYGRLCL